MFGADNKTTALVILRVVLATLLFIHGAARISAGTVGGFGEFLGSNGIPLGFFVAWGITLFELIGSVLLAVGFYASIIAMIFALELATGVGLVHWKQGWFVVGGGTGGMEYSVLLIAGFVATAIANYRTSSK